MINDLNVQKKTINIADLENKPIFEEKKFSKSYTNKNNDFQKIYLKIYLKI